MKEISVFVCRGCKYLEPCVFIPVTNISENTKDFYVPRGCLYNCDDFSWKFEKYENVKMDELFEKIKRKEFKSGGLNGK